MKSNSNNPWKTLKSKKIYNNDWVRLVEHQVITPGNTNGIYGVVEFLNYAIGIIPLDHDNNTWLVGQHRYPLNEYSWEIPMGGGLKSDEILTSAKRELLEETGIQASSWSNIMKIHTSNCVTNETGYVFLAQDLSFHKPQPDITEDLTVKKVPFKEAIDMVMAGNITDSISIAGILKLSRVLKM